jgi:hypothetical protein
MNVLAGETLRDIRFEGRIYEIATSSFYLSSAGVIT